MFNKKKKSKKHDQVLPYIKHPVTSGIKSESEFFLAPKLEHFFSEDKL